MLTYCFDENPRPWEINFRGLFLLISGLSCLILPAAAFRGLENFSLSLRLLFNIKKSFFDKKTSPLTSKIFGEFEDSFFGIV